MLTCRDERAIPLTLEYAFGQTQALACMNELETCQSYLPQYAARTDLAVHQ